MKPMGTITKYYPFIEEDDKSILNELMDEATSYFDFAHKICNLVVRERTSDNLAYIAAVQAWWCRLEEAMTVIQVKYGEVPYIKPWRYIHATDFKDQEENHDRVVESIDEAIESSPPDWIVIELHLLHAFFHYPFHGDIPSLIEPLEKAKVLVESNSLLNCFESLIDALEAWAKGLE